MFVLRMPDEGQVGVENEREMAWHDATS
jgi:hypothetical protein